MIKCLYCGKENKNKKYCNIICYNKYRHSLKPDIKCDNCGKIFKKRPRDITKNNFCCVKCYSEWEKGKNNPAWKGGKEFWKKKKYIRKTPITEKKYYGNCLICGKLLKKDQINCCCYKCRTIYTQKNTKIRIEKECEYCKSLFLPSNSFIRFCSMNCKDEYQRNIMIGKGNSNYKNKDYDRKYPYIWNTKFKKEFKEKFNYTCKICKVIDKSIHIHHIDENKNNCDYKNLVCVCNSCHNKIHRGSIKL